MPIVSFILVSFFFHPPICPSQDNSGTDWHQYFLSFCCQNLSYFHICHKHCWECLFVCNCQAASSEEDEVGKDDVKENTTKMNKVGAEARLVSHTAVHMISLHTFWVWCYLLREKCVTIKDVIFGCLKVVYWIYLNKSLDKGSGYRDVECHFLGGSLVREW